MTIFDEISKEASIDKNQHPILKFHSYTIVGSIGRGQQGMVVKAKNQIGKEFAIKFSQPTDKDSRILAKSIKRFKKEPAILSRLSHHNIVKVHTAGYAIWDEDKKQWKIKEGFKKFKASDDKILFYVMDFIYGSELNSIFKNIQGGKEPLVDSQHKLKLFEELISQILLAMKYYHNNKITHGDIKEENIRYSENDSTFILVDFGFAEPLDKRHQKSSIIERKKYLDLKAIDGEKFDLADIGQFSFMLKGILETFKNQYDEDCYKGILQCLSRATNDDLTYRYKDAYEFYNDVKQFFKVSPEWRFQLRLHDFLAPELFGKFESKVRIPVSGSVLLTKEVRQIIDMPEFQRLRGIRQLGPTIFVFPGANHTRFEHSLGTYFLILRFLERIVNQIGFRELFGPNLAEAIKLAVLSALLHDIGHYPYSHWIEEINEYPNGVTFPTHENRARKIICESPFAEKIQNDWGVDPNMVANIISGDDLKKTGFLHSLISSVFDADKLDYLIRDGVHCGVDYGKGIDLERILDSLHVHSKKQRLTVTDKGLSALLSVATCRYIMYQEVYWHKTVRSCEAMFKRFFYEYISEKASNAKKVDEWFQYSDDMFINNMYKEAKRIKLESLLKPFAFEGREIYKPVFTFHPENIALENYGGIKKFFENIHSDSYADLVLKGNALAEKLKKKTANLKPHQILIEKVPTNEKKRSIAGLQFYNSKMKDYDTIPPEWDTLNKRLNNSWQAFIFCHPDHYQSMKNIGLDELDTMLT